MIDDFFKPLTQEEALELYRSRPDAFWYGGGTALNYGGSPPSGAAIGLERLDLDFIRREGDRLCLGASVTLQEMIDHPLVPEVLKKAAGFINFRNIRNMATLGGNLGAKAPDSCLIPLLIALEAELETASEGKMPVENYCSGPSRDLILSLRVPLPGKAAVVKRADRTSSSAPYACAAVVLRDRDKAADRRDFRIVLNGLGGCFTRLEALEELIRRDGPVGRDALEREAAALLDPEEDYRCSREYKRLIASVLVAEGVLECLEVNP